MMEKSSSQYDSFLFWRQPIPALDLSELDNVAATGGCGATGGGVGGVQVKDKKCKARAPDVKPELSEFSSFNYWRAPIADVDALLADLNLLL